jgi:hypothetical protein
MVTTTFTGETFDYHKILGSHQRIAHLEFNRCWFTGGVLSQDDDPECDFVVEDVKVSRCKSGPFECHGVRFVDVAVENPTNRPRLNPLGCLFQHVTIHGTFGTVRIEPSNSRGPSLPDDFAEAAKKFYEGVDWALDISDAKINDCVLTYVPGHLVRRDPETQLLIHKDRVRDVDPESLPFPARFAAWHALRSPFDTVVAVASLPSKDFARELSELEELRRRGIAE